jgi:hypothetical protein
LLRLRKEFVFRQSPLKQRQPELCFLGFTREEDVHGAGDGSIRTEGRLS